MTSGKGEIAWMMIILFTKYFFIEFIINSNLLPTDRSGRECKG